jgi:hypothetical protein
MRLVPFNPFLILRHLSISPLLVCMVLLPSHHPLIDCHVSYSFHDSLLLKTSPSYLVSYPFRLLSSAMCFPLTSFSHLITSYHPLMMLAPPLLLCALSFALASTPSHRAIQLIQVATRRAVHIPEVSS